MLVLPFSKVALFGADSILDTLDNSGRCLFLVSSVSDGKSSSIDVKEKRESNDMAFLPWRLSFGCSMVGQWLSRHANYRFGRLRVSRTESHERISLLPTDSVDTQRPAARYARLLLIFCLDKSKTLLGAATARSKCEQRAFQEENLFGKQ